MPVWVTCSMCGGRCQPFDPVPGALMAGWLCVPCVAREPEKGGRGKRGGQRPPPLLVLTALSEVAIRQSDPFWQLQQKRRLLARLRDAAPGAPGDVLRAYREVWAEATRAELLLRKQHGPALVDYLAQSDDPYSEVMILRSLETLGPLGYSDRDIARAILPLLSNGRPPRERGWGSAAPDELLRKRLPSYRALLKTVPEPA